MNKLISLSQFVSWLNSMTTTELMAAFPTRMHQVESKDSIQIMTTKYYMNQANLFDMVKEYNQFLLMPLKLEMFSGEKALFEDFRIETNFEGNFMNSPREAKVVADLTQSGCDITLTEYALKSIIKYL